MASKLEQRVETLEAEMLGDESIIDQLEEVLSDDPIYYEVFADNDDDVRREDVRLAAALKQQGTFTRQFAELPSAGDRAIAYLLTDAADDGEPLAIERLRGLMPDAVIRAAYDLLRNYQFFADGAVKLRVRQLAGVVDEIGNPLPGYRMTANGAIVDAPESDERPAG